MYTYVIFSKKSYFHDSVPLMQPQNTYGRHKTSLISHGIVAHWKHSSTMYRWRWHCWGVPPLTVIWWVVFYIPRLSCV